MTNTIIIDLSNIEKNVQNHASSRPSGVLNIYLEQ